MRRLACESRSDSRIRVGRPQRLAVNAVRHELDRADRNEGRRGLLLRTLDALGIGFDS